MIFLCGGMVWGVELVHMVEVGGGIKKSQGVYSYILYRRFMRIYTEYPISNIQTT